MASADVNEREDPLSSIVSMLETRVTTLLNKFKNMEDQLGILQRTSTMSKRYRTAHRQYAVSSVKAHYFTASREFKVPRKTVDDQSVPLRIPLAKSSDDEEQRHCNQAECLIPQRLSNILPAVPVKPQFRRAKLVLHSRELTCDDFYRNLEE
ncbi:hypothetical protein CHS0354_002169 [Potamilus streckersoni]|uniref:Uncharacterized protein n=1 Tax=Potamilus streckersoni TaxID=2493646 RepID=A0AAE0RSC3_9BIVA|nr:hypothetical protein CHS0354_002169 [Potamilus streckersoni]